MARDGEMVNLDHLPQDKFSPDMPPKHSPTFRNSEHPSPFCSCDDERVCVTDFLYPFCKLCPGNCPRDVCFYGRGHV